jgi:hypothetical protein
VIATVAAKAVTVILDAAHQCVTDCLNAMFFLHSEA